MACAHLKKGATKEALDAPSTMLRVVPPPPRVGHGRMFATAMEPFAAHHPPRNTKGEMLRVISSTSSGRSAGGRGALWAIGPVAEAAGDADRRHVRRREVEPAA